MKYELKPLCPPPTLQAQFEDVKDSELQAMDRQISELGAEVQSVTQSCRQLDAGRSRGFIRVTVKFFICTLPTWEDLRCACVCAKPPFRAEGAQ